MPARTMPSHKNTSVVGNSGIINNMDHEEFKKIPNRLKKYRKIHGLSQRRVAAILGKKSSSHISNWENGRVIPNLSNAIRLSVLYRTPVDGLFVGHDRVLREEVRVNEKRIIEDTCAMRRN